MIWYGSTGAAMAESLAALAADGIHLDRLRIRAFPFADAVAEFIAAHEQVFVVEQNRDAQLACCSSTSAASIPPSSSPCCTTTARRSPRASSRSEIGEKAANFNVTPLRKVAPLGAAD